ncbi:hypothetical protein N9338_09375 [Luminiphilus sp.]|nr:hypothetical protein [Luminiphilus sp.]
MLVQPNVTAQNVINIIRVQWLATILSSHCAESDAPTVLAETIDVLHDGGGIRLS